MASVAVAIEKAASRSEKLWWDSHRKLLEDLEELVDAEENAGGLSDRQLQRQKEMEQGLLQHRHWLLNLLLCFKPPDSASKDALDSSKITVGSKSFDVTNELKDAALAVSKHLELDQIQSFCLLKQVIDEGNFGVISPDDPLLLQNVTMAYFLERQCLLKCTRLLVTQIRDVGGSDRQATAGPSTFDEALSKMVKEFMQVGLEDIILENVKSSLRFRQPQKWDPVYAQPWAEEMAIEQGLLMDLLFILYNRSLCVCIGSKWAELLRTFQELFEAPSADIVATTHMSRLVRIQALLTLIVSLDLTKLLLLLQAGTTFSQGGHGFSLEDLQNIDAHLSGLDLNSAPEYAPLLLAWATFLCLVSALPDQAMVLDVEHALYAQQAYKSGACDFLLSVLRCESLKYHDFQATAYYGAVKTLSSACLAAYDFASQVETGIHDQFLEIIAEAYDGQEALCTEFWDRDNVVDAPIRRFLYSLRQHFPHKMLGFLWLLKSLCCGPWSAECVYNFLCKGFPVTCIYQSKEHDVRGATVQLSAAVPVPHCPGLYIPAGVLGHCVKSYNDNLFLVHWECEHSSLLVLLVYMGQWFKDTAEEVKAIVALLNRLLSWNQNLCRLVLELDRSPLASLSRMDGRMDKALTLDVIGVVSSVIHSFLGISSDLDAIAEGINLLQKFVYCCPAQVMISFEKTDLIGPVGTTRFVDQHFEHKYWKSEQSSGCYPVTLAVLNIVASFLEKGIRIESLASFVLYSCHNLLVNHGNWKYKDRSQRWILSAKIFRMLRIVLGSRIWYPDKLRNLLFEAISKDSIIQGVLLNILMANASSLEELYVNRSFDVNEIDCLLQAVRDALELVDVIILHMLDEANPKDPTIVSAFCQSLFHNPTTPLVNVVSSYLGFRRHKELQVLSLRLLGKLCQIGQKARPQSVNVASYLCSADTRKLLRKTLANILSEDQAFAEPLLFDGVLDFLATAVKSQPSMAELLLFPYESSSGGKKETEVLDALWKLLAVEFAVSKRSVEIMFRLMLLVASLWQGGTEYLAAIDVLRQQSRFWDVLSSIAAKTLRSKVEEIPTRESAVTDGLCYCCQTFVYQIMVHDMFVRDQVLDLKSKETGDSPGPRKVILEWGATGQIKAILQSYGTSTFREEFMHHIKAEARTFVVGLIVKLLMGDDKGMDASLVKRLCESSSQILLHPSFKELSTLYARRGYRFSHSVELLVMTDFYYNLQGELNGRKISSASYQQLADFLADLKIEMALVPVSNARCSEDYTFEDDVKTLRSALGLECWDQNGQIISIKAVEKFLFDADRANAITYLADSQLLAISAFSDVLKMFSRSKRVNQDDRTPRISWKLATLTTSTEEICSGLDRQVTDSHLKRDRVLYLQKFVAALSSLLVDVTWQLVTHHLGEKEDCGDAHFRVIRTCFTYIKFALEEKLHDDGTINSLLGCVLLNLEAVCGRKGDLKAAEGYASEGQRFLPVLCETAEIKSYSNFSLATINILIRRFLASSTWLPILQACFPTKSVLSRMVIADPEREKSCGVIIRLCLYLSRFRGAADMLHSADFLHYLLMLNAQLRDGEVDEAQGPFSTKSSSSQESIWALGVATLAAMLRTLGDGEVHQASILESAVAYMRAERSRMLNALRPPNYYMDSQAPRKRHQFQASSASLQETQFVAAFLCELVRHGAIYFGQNDLAEIREMVVHLLAYIAREGLVRAALSDSVRCPPLQRQEALAHSRPSTLGSSSAWFLICARGSAVKNATSSATGNEIVPSTAISHSEYSEGIAVQVYKIATLLLHFLVTQARQAIHDTQEGRSRVFPELPAPEVLHALQDQALAVVREMSTSKTGRNLEPEVLDICSMLLGILEKSLYLEACILRIYGISPVSLRAEDFAREYGALVLAAEYHPGLQASVAALKDVASLVYPGVS